MKCLWACGLLGCLATAPLRAADADADDSQRRQTLAAERAVAQARYDAAARECQSAFAVTGCLDHAKAERRRTLDRIARDEAALDDAQRRRRAEERRQRIAAKQQAAAARAAAAASAPGVDVRVPRATVPASGAARPSRRAEPRTPEEQAAEEAAARERAEQSQQRRERAAAHEEAVRQRNAERAARKPPAAPLPVPASAPAR